VRRFLTPAVFTTCIVAWMSVACFVWARDLMMVGWSAPSFARDEVITTLQSMLLWGLFSPFILIASQRLEFERGRKLRALVIHGLLAIALSAFDALCDLLISLVTGLDERTFQRRFYSEVFINVFSYMAVAGIGYALVYQWRLAASRVSALELQRELAQARLDSLARTLQPHFLFNALNSVAALIRLQENQRALSAVVALSDLLRIVLKTRGEARVPLSEELEVTGRYVAVEQFRFEDRLQVSQDIQPGAESLFVPALILQPLIENAIRHGVEHSGRGHVTIEARHDEQALSISVKVRCLGECADPKVTGLGIGLDVTRRRLAYIYGEDRCPLDLLISGGNSSVTLRIPLEAAHA
jgi:two-component system, LytTR family, sensor kinase